MRMSRSPMLIRSVVSGVAMFICSVVSGVPMFICSVVSGVPMFICSVVSGVPMFICQVISGVPMHVFGPEEHMTSIVGMALGKTPVPDDTTGEASSIRDNFLFGKHDIDR